MQQDVMPQAWRDWIKENLQRGCDAQGMAMLMVRDGGFAANVARSAIARIAAELGQHTNETTAETGGNTLVTRPEIDTSGNLLEIDGRQVRVLMSMEQPRVVLIGNLLSHEECDALVAYCAERMAPSPVVDMVAGSNALHEHRTSRGAMLQRGESELVARIEQRLASLVNWPVENGEGMQILRYEVGHEYRAHFDWFDPEQSGPRKHLQHGGQRYATIVMYLSDVEKGGGTSFPAIGLQTPPAKGSAVFFCNVDAFGVPDKLTLHAGMPVMGGTKLIATKWLRERQY
ncbi:2OG-Fe(II) oxygenase [Massilia sp. W12]|uniref:2OG-Fe(II) oxygenase n=1 Tax=Massilia sp. W12 TaxID=3126507 RepID=UPI0030D2B58D